MKFFVCSYSKTLVPTRTYGREEVKRIKTTETKIIFVKNYTNKVNTHKSIDKRQSTKPSSPRRAGHDERFDRIQTIFIQTNVASDKPHAVEVAEIVYENGLWYSCGKSHFTENVNI